MMIINNVTKLARPRGFVLHKPLVNHYEFEITAVPLSREFATRCEKNEAIRCWVRYFVNQITGEGLIIFSIIFLKLIRDKLTKMGSFCPIRDVPDSSVPPTVDRERAGEGGNMNVEQGNTSNEAMESNADVFNRLQKLDMKRGWGLYTNTNDGCQWGIMMLELGLNKLPMELRREDIIGKEFCSYEKAELFFNLYAKVIGFSVRKSHKRTSAVGEIKNRTWLCSKEGHRHEKFLNLPNRKKEARCLTREGCNVKFRVNFAKCRGRWIAKEFKTEHSHPLAIASHIQFLRSSKEISGGALATAKAMKASGIRTCHIMGYIARQVGGFDNVRFGSKDLYNKLARSSHVEPTECDAAMAVGFLQHKCELEENFFGKYSLDKEGRLQNILWADTQSRADYKLFGHALAFDTTYRSNKYSKPFLVFVGVNHHFRTIIFGMALLIDETEETYMWALDTFLECMEAARPRTVITDGDMAMRNAIIKLMPDTVRRLCALHLHQNVVTNIKDCGFAGALKKLMFRRFTIPEFERQWDIVVQEFGLEQNMWLSNFYKKREQWADTFLRGNFFAGMRTTQRSEGMHAFLKSKIKASVKLIDFVMAMDHAICWLRHKEAEDQFKSVNSKPLTNVTNMSDVEVQAADLFTIEMFYKIREEIKREGGYLVEAEESKDNILIYTVTKYATKQAVRRVMVDSIKEKFECDCYLFPTTGIPCRHIFATMKKLHLTHIPDSLLCTRWMKDARRTMLMKSNIITPWSSNRSDKEARFGHLTNKCSEIAFMGAADDGLFQIAVQEIEKLTAKLNGIVKAREENQSDAIRSGLRNPVEVQNPQYSQSKGGSGSTKLGGRTRKRCSQCQGYGHNKKTCTNSRRGKGVAEAAVDEEEFHDKATEDVCVQHSGEGSTFGDTVTGLHNEITDGIRLSEDQPQSTIPLRGVVDVVQNNDYHVVLGENRTGNEDIAGVQNFWWGEPYGGMEE